MERTRKRRLWLSLGLSLGVGLLMLRSDTYMAIVWSDAAIVTSSSGMREAYRPVAALIVLVTLFAIWRVAWSLTARLGQSPRKQKEK